MAIWKQIPTTNTKITFGINKPLSSMIPNLSNPVRHQSADIYEESGVLLNNQR